MEKMIYHTEDGKWDEMFMSQLGQQTEDSEEEQESEMEVDVQTESIGLHVPEGCHHSLGGCTELSRKSWAYIHLNDIHWPCS